MGFRLKGLGIMDYVLGFRTDVTGSQDLGFTVTVAARFGLGLLRLCPSRRLLGCRWSLLLLCALPRSGYGMEDLGKDLGFRDGLGCGI